MGMGKVKHKINEIFGNEVLPGDFIVGLSGRREIVGAEYALYTPYKTKFIAYKNPYYYNYHDINPKKLTDYYNDLNYYDFVEDNLAYTTSNNYYKMTKLDNDERVIYEKLKLNYDIRMRAVDYYLNNRKELPIGSIVSTRDEFHPKIYLGHCMETITSMASEYSPFLEDLKEKILNLGIEVNLEKSYIYNTCLGSFYIYLNLSPVLSKISFQDILDGKVSFQDILSNYGTYSSKFTLSKSLSTNYYYCGYIDVSSLMNEYKTFDLNNMYLLNEKHGDISVHKNFNDLVNIFGNMFMLRCDKSRNMIFLGLK